MKEKICLCILLCVQHFVPAQNISSFLHFDHYTVSTGLPGNDVNTLFQDSRKFLWIGTSDGLSRYDGNVFKNYTHIGNNGLTDLHINRIAEDAEGNIWIATESGLNKIDPFTEKITRYYEGSGPGTIPYKWCNTVYIDKAKNLWISTEKGVARYEKTTDRFINYPVTVFGSDARINKSIPKIMEDNKGRCWLATSYGIKIFDLRTGKTIRSFQLYKNDDARQNMVTSLFEDAEGRIWAGSFASGLFQYDESKQEFILTEIPGLNIKDYVIEDISQLQLQDKLYLLLATGDQVFSIEYPAIAKNQSTTTIPLLQLDNAIVSKETYSIKHLFTDKEKNLWWGGRNGLYKMNADRFACQWIPVHAKENAAPFIFHILPDIKDPRNIFYLTCSYGWWKYNSLTGTATQHLLPSNENNRLVSINNWIADEHGYWFTSVHGFGYYDLYNNKMVDLSSIPEKLTGERSTGYIVKDLSGKFWITLRRSGILVFDPSTQKFEQLFSDTTKEGNVYGYTITDLKTGPDNQIYFCAKNKLHKVDPVNRSVKTFTPSPYPGMMDEGKTAPFKIVFTKDKRLLVMSSVRIYELKNEKLDPVYPKESLSDFIMEKMFLDDETVWIVTRNTVLKTTTSFSKWIDKGGLPGMENTSPFEIYTGNHDQVMFTGEGGISILKENNSPAAIKPSEVIISRVKHGNNEIFLASEKETTFRTHYKNSLEIEISPASYLSNNENKVLYKLEGWDREWNELKTTTPLRYEQLPPGHYTFKAKAKNISGEESKESVFSFTIIPPFYRTWWFIGLIVLVIGSSIFLFYRSRLHAALKLERMRTSIATDLHDDIGATLSSISMYSEALKSQVKDQLPHLQPVLDKMGENSRDMVNSMSDIVWAINPDNDNGKKLAERMESHARDMCAIKNISLQFSGDPAMSEIKLPLDYRKNIYLIFKESLNNALKYSGATEIVVKIGKDNNTLQLIVKDNGKGFDIDTVKKGNGLKNMEQRAKEIGSTLQVKAIAGNGTAVELNCPL